MAKRFNVAIQTEDEDITLSPMKEWLRRNPDHIPEGMDPNTSTSHELRNGLKKKGWLIRETETEVHLIMPGSEVRIGEVFGDVDEAVSNNTIPEAALFQLEYQLRDFLSQNLSTALVDGKRIKLYVDPTGRDGVEYPTATGPIDILGIDDKGNFYVFELKRAQSPDSAIGQLARYMGWVKRTIGKDHNVNGVIIAKSISDRLRYAVSVLPNVSLFEYEVEFRLNQASEFKV
jgi:hypothetical protein